MCEPADLFSRMGLYPMEISYGNDSRFMVISVGLVDKRGEKHQPFTAYESLKINTK